MTSSDTPVVVINYEDLIDPSADVTTAILRAFDADGLGVIAIRKIPDWISLVEKTIPLAHRLVNLPAETLASLEHPESLYNSGWSFGKEKLGDKPDTNKASYYFNPLSDDPRPDMREAYPWALPANRWPHQELPEFERMCKKLGSVMQSVTVSLARRIDSMNLGTKIADEMESSLKAKGRMLYYYPVPNKADTIKPDGWIGWHNDSGFLTALTPDMYFRDSTGERIANPEPDTAGLWVAARNGERKRVIVPQDCMAIQCGECLQVITGGRLVATPHCVRPPMNSPDVSRACMPVFVDVSPEFKLVSPAGREAVFVNTVKQWVPPLSERWTDGESFADFLGASFKAYYAWAS